MSEETQVKKIKLFLCQGHTCCGTMGFLLPSWSASQKQLGFMGNTLKNQLLEAHNGLHSKMSD